MIFLINPQGLTRKGTVLRKQAEVLFAVKNTVLETAYE